MSFHEDYEAWERRTEVEGCPICRADSMPEGMEDVWETAHTWLDAQPVECMKYVCHATSRCHGVELYDLSDEELLGFLKDVQRYAKVLKTVTGAVKINYEIHGNTIPHLHVHRYPRFCDDPFPGQPIDYRKKRRDLYQEGEYQTFLWSLQNELDSVFEEEHED